jgi:hypothetical protein
MGASRPPTAPRDCDSNLAILLLGVFAFSVRVECLLAISYGLCSLRRLRAAADLRRLPGTGLAGSCSPWPTHRRCLQRSSHASWHAQLSALKVRASAPFRGMAARQLV